MWSFTVTQLYHQYYWYTSYFKTCALIDVHMWPFTISPALLIHPLLWNLCMYEFVYVIIYCKTSSITCIVDTALIVEPVHVWICICDNNSAILPALLIQPLLWNLCMYESVYVIIIQLYYLHCWYSPYCGTCDIWICSYNLLL